MFVRLKLIWDFCATLKCSYAPSKWMWQMWLRWQRLLQCHLLDKCLEVSEYFHRNWSVLDLYLHSLFISNKYKLYSSQTAYFWQHNTNWVHSSFHTNPNTSLLLLISYLYTFWQQTRPHLWDQYLMLIFLPSCPLFLSTIHHTDSYFLSSPVK